KKYKIPLPAIHQTQTNTHLNQAATNPLSPIKIIQPQTKLKPPPPQKINQKPNQLPPNINHHKQPTPQQRQLPLHKINQFLNQAITHIT
ncbi:hypothetical protein, partial [Staphylococcus aureus]|uniref:hypothetical protein n=1 Tax=Staphylococcus aureus TaxID=1280 RepID=UPI001C92FA83